MYSVRCFSFSPCLSLELDSELRFSFVGFFQEMGFTRQAGLSTPTALEIWWCRISKRTILLGGKINDFFDTVSSHFFRLY